MYKNNKGCKKEEKKKCQSLNNISIKAGFKIVIVIGFGYAGTKYFIYVFIYVYRCNLPRVHILQRNITSPINLRSLKARIRKLE